MVTLQPPLRPCVTDIANLPCVRYTIINYIRRQGEKLIYFRMQ